eukprot:7656205-Alexandrium_andersonii.AAC.1
MCIRDSMLDCVVLACGERPGHLLAVGGGQSPELDAHCRHGHCFGAHAAANLSLIHISEPTRLALI